MLVPIADGARLFAQVMGAALAPEPASPERPWIVLLHGGPGSDHTVFLGESLDRLADSCNVLLYDHRGNGRSDRSDESRWNLDQWASDLVSLCHELEIVRPIVWGASFGGFVAQRYLELFPAHAKRVVLAGTASHLDADAIAMRFERLAGSEAGDAARIMFSGLSLTQDVAAVWTERCVPLYSSTQDAVEVLHRPLRNDVLRRSFYSGEARTMRFQHPARAQTPVFWVWGRSDPVFPGEVSRAHVDNLASVDFAVVDGSHLEAVTSWDNAVVRDFLLGRSS